MLDANCSRLSSGCEWRLFREKISWSMHNRGNYLEDTHSFKSPKVSPEIIRAQKVCERNSPWLYMCVLKIPKNIAMIF
jgi:hypothetical protein